MGDKKKRTWRDSLGFCIGCGVGLVAFYVLLTIGHYYNDGWGPDQWGPVASWVSGLATSFAVGVALYQTKLARDDAEQAKAGAFEATRRDDQRREQDLAAADARLQEERERHAVEIENSKRQFVENERLHREQLQAQNDANARAEQLLAVREISVALNRIHTRTLQFTNRFRFETEQNIAFDRMHTDRWAWSSEMTTQSIAIQMARIGVTDLELQKNIERALREAKAITDGLSVSVPEEIDWNASDTLIKDLIGTTRVITSWTIATMQPSFLQALRAIAESESSPNQTDPPGMA
ncbi:hypothetical protein [Rhodococcus sp. IEGM1428]|uniref:hypothetical protein n=1 Tax=Rhodococcus sp. IEGM1428 TaxID=3392191 RepID=UPI003D0DDB0E